MLSSPLAKNTEQKRHIHGMHNALQILYSINDTQEDVL